MDQSPDKALMDQILVRYRVEQFYTIEAELLDGRQFEAWLDLLADDIRYWMPVTRNRNFGEWDGEHTNEGEDLNWFDEGKFELEQRVKQIMTGIHWAEEPVSRTTHMFSNLQVIDESADTLLTRVRFLIYRNRNETETDFFVGKRHDKLRHIGEGFEVAAREIYLDQSVLQAKNLTIFF